MVDGQAKAVIEKLEELATILQIYSTLAKQLSLVVFDTTLLRENQSQYYGTTTITTYKMA